MGKQKIDYLNQKEFGDLCGVSGVAIKKAIDTGRVAKGPKGIDPSAPINLEYRTANNRQRAEQGEEAGGVRDKPPTRDITKLPKWELSSQEIKDLRTLRQIEANELKNDIERGKYVERETVTKVFRELAAIDKKELMNIAIRSANTILALLEADSTQLPAIVAEIKGEVWKVLEQKKELLKMFIEDDNDN